MKAKWMLGLLGMLLVGCGAEGDFDAQYVDPAENEIIGGTATTGYPNIIALFAAKPGETQGALCTASVVSPTVLLTAAHCVDPASVGEGMVFKALFGYDITNATTSGPVINVANVYWNKAFDINNPAAGNDIAVAILSTPTDVAPLPINRAAITDAMVGQPATIVGYGLNNAFQQSGAGVKRVATVKLNSFDASFVKTGQLTKGICNGDSGGPVLMSVGGKPTIVGVNSFGMIFCLGAASSTRVDAYLDFVDQYVN